MSNDGAGRKLIRSHRDLEVYQMAFQASMQIFRLTRGFPVEERYSLVDQALIPIGECQYRRGMAQAALRRQLRTET